MKKYFIMLGSLQVFIALGAIPAGLDYLMNITGQGMGTSVEMLKNSPLKIFLIPALFLLIVHCFGNLSGAVLSFRKMPVSGKTGFALGVILSIWIIMQAYWIGLSSFMQPLFFIFGLFEIFLGLIIIKKA